MKLIERLWKDEQAPTSAEYALLLTFIAVAIFGAVGALGQAVNSAFQNPTLLGALP